MFIDYSLKVAKFQSVKNKRIVNAFVMFCLTSHPTAFKSKLGVGLRPDNLR